MIDEDHLKHVIRQNHVQVIDSSDVDDEAPFGVAIVLPPQTVHCEYYADKESAELYADRVAVMLARLIVFLSPDSAAGALVLQERTRQVIELGWTPEHDDTHRQGELGIAAAIYAMPDYRRTDDLLLEWPWDDTQPKFGDRLRELVKATALLHAEIGRELRTKLPDFHQYSG